MMALEIKLVASGFPLGVEQERRGRRRLGALERRLALRSDPIAILRLTRHADQRRVEVELRVQLGSLGEHLVSRQAAETLDAALRLAVGDVERQLERGLATQRGEPTFGSPSRRLPKALRPHPPGSAAPVAPMAKGDR